MFRSRIVLSRLKNKFDRVVILGSGPTEFQHPDLKMFRSEPVFFINQMHKFSHLCPSAHKFFFTHHISEFREVEPTTVWIRRMFLSEHSYEGHIETRIKPKNDFIGIDCQADDIVIDDTFISKHSWLLDRNEVLKRNRFLALFGTITTAIHFAWFCGAKKITFIGCNPFSGSIEHDPRVGGKMIYSPEMVHQNTLLLPKYFDIHTEHIK